MTEHERFPACDEPGEALPVHGDRALTVACTNTHCRVYAFKRYWEVGT